MWSELGSTANISHRVGREWVGCPYSRICEATTPPARHSTPVSATQQTAALVFAGVCTRFPILSVPLSSFLFSLNPQTTDFNLLPKNQWKKSVWVGRMQRRLPRRFINLSLSWPELQFSTKVPENNLSAFPFHQEAIAQLLHWYLQQGPFEATDWHVFSVYFLIKKNHMH